MVKLGDVYSIRKGKKVEETPELPDSIRYVQIDDLRNNNNIKFCANKSDYVIATEKDIIIAWDGANAGTCGYGLSGAIGSTLALLSTNREDIDADYAGAFLKTKFEYLQGHCTGATIPHVNRKSLENIKIPLPPISVQKKITDALNKISGLIEKRKEQFGVLDKLAKDTFIDMFGDPVLNTMGWPIEKLEKHLKIMGGFAFESKKYSTTGIPIIRIGNANSGVMRMENAVFYEEDKNLTKYELFPQDIVITLTGTVGKDDYGNVCVITNQYPKYYLNQRVAKLETFLTLNKVFLKYILLQPEIKRKLTDVSRGVRQANISNKDIYNLLIPLPPIEIQNQFAERIVAIETQKSRLQDSLLVLDTIFKATIQKAFNGELFQGGV